MERLSLIFACAPENKSGSRGQNSSNKNSLQMNCSFKVLCPDPSPVLILFYQAGLLSLTPEHRSKLCTVE